MGNLRIAVICNSYPTKVNRNNQIFIKNMNDELAKLSVDSDVYYNPIYDYWTEPSSHKNIFATLLKYTFFFGGLIKIFFHIKSYKILNPHGVILSGFSATLLKSVFKIPVILYVHGGDLNLYPTSSFIYKIIYDFTLEQSNIVIVNSNDIKNKLIQYTQIKSDKIRIISPGINLDHFYSLSLNKTNQLKKKYNVSRNKIILLFVGNAIKRKGLDIFVDALLLLNNEQQNKIEIIICASGPELIGFKSKISQLLTLHNSTKYFDKVNQITLNEFYNIATLFIFPSREEPLGLVGLESIASGTPVVGANIGGIPEYINDENGVLFEPNNPQDLASILKRLIDNPKQLNNLISNLGSEHTKHSIHRSAKSLKTLYKMFFK